MHRAKKRASIPADESQLVVEFYVCNAPDEANEVIVIEFAEIDV
jgi:hypothetical protein